MKRSRRIGPFVIWEVFCRQCREWVPYHPPTQITLPHGCLEESGD